MAIKKVVESKKKVYILSPELVESFRIMGEGLQVCVN